MITTSHSFVLCSLCCAWRRGCSHGVGILPKKPLSGNELEGGGIGGGRGGGVKLNTEGRENRNGGNGGGRWGNPGVCGDSVGGHGGSAGRCGGSDEMGEAMENELFTGEMTAKLEDARLKDGRGGREDMEEDGRGGRGGIEEDGGGNSGKARESGWGGRA